MNDYCFFSCALVENAHFSKRNFINFNVSIFIIHSHNAFPAYICDTKQQNLQYPHKMRLRKVFSHIINMKCKMPYTINRRRTCGIAIIPIFSVFERNEFIILKCKIKNIKRGKKN